jgi:hypothetical protein
LRRLSWFEGFSVTCIVKPSARGTISSNQTVAARMAVSGTPPIRIRFIGTPFGAGGEHLNPQTRPPTRPFVVPYRPCRRIAKVGYSAVGQPSDNALLETRGLGTSLEQRTVAGSPRSADGWEDAAGNDRQCQKLLHHPDDQPHPVNHSELTVKALEVRVDRMGRNAKLGGDATFRVVVENPPQDLQFAPGKPERTGDFAPRLLAQHCRARRLSPGSVDRRGFGRSIHGT